MATSTERILEVVWGNRRGYVFLPHKDATDPGYPKGGWHETDGFTYDGTLPDLEQLPAQADLYFCPVVFSENRRKKEYALPTNVLWSDLDPIHPDQCPIKPSIAWESSPGRYQALWLLDQEIEPDRAAELSKRIAYAVGGDKGGWDLTQVLRIPGSTNFKYPSRPPGRLLWAKKQNIPVGQIERTYPHLNGHSVPSNSNGSSGSVTWIDVPESVVQGAILSLPIGIRRQLSASTEGQDRSLRLLQLARSLLKRKLDYPTVLAILQRSSWNKFAGRSDEHEQLIKQVESAQKGISLPSTTENTTAPTSSAGPVESGTNGVEIVQPMRVYGWTEFLSIPTQLKWLVQDSWVDRTVGFISGRSKSYKTWIALDFVLSLLSGTPFLGQFEVKRTGPVLLIQEEDPTAILQERLKLIAKAKGMLPKVKWTPNSSVISLEYTEYPLAIINLQGFSLTNPVKVAQVRRIIGDLNPVAVVMDPLINMLMGSNVDTNDAVQIAEVLREVKMWREEFGCNSVIVHHWNKMRSEEGDRGGEHMYGSFAMHAWLESAIHVSPLIDPESTRIDTVVAEREFKAAPGSKSLKIKFDIDSAQSYTYAVNSLAESLGPISETLMDLLRGAGTWTTTAELVALSGFRREKVAQEMGALVRAKRVEVRRGGGRGQQTSYKLVDLSSTD